MFCYAVVIFHCSDFGSCGNEKLRQRSETGPYFKNMLILLGSGFSDDPFKEVFIQKEVLAQTSAGAHSATLQLFHKFLFIHNSMLVSAASARTAAAAG
jgi:hypothetical protein